MPSECADDVIALSLQVKTEKMVPTVEDLPRGPLDVYRKKASFNWKEMLLFLEGEEICAMKVTFLNSGV